MSIRAYRVRVLEESASLIIFAKSRTHAIKMASKEYLFEEVDYIDLRARLAPEFEALNKNEERLLDFCDNAGFFKKLEWTCATIDMCPNTNCPFIIAAHNN